MLTITVLGDEYFDEEKSELVYPHSFELQLEHSLASLSKWEEIYEKPFLDKAEKSNEEIRRYFQLMIVTPGVDPDIVDQFTQANIDEINRYIGAKMTATWFSDVQGSKQSGEKITAELIYYWMNVCQIDLEWENRHLSKLFTLIRVHSAKSGKQKPMSRAEAARKQRELNARRRAESGSRG